MTRQIPVDRPLSDEDRAYLHMRGQHSRVEMIDQTYPASSEGAPAEVEYDDQYDNWTVAELKKELGNREGLAQTGTKAELIARLREDDTSEESDEDDEEEDEEDE